MKPRARLVLNFYPTVMLRANIVQIVVSGPAVAGGEARLGVIGRIRDDSTLAYV
jgi:hypothetical protein